MNPDSMQVTVDGRDVELTAHEFKLLLCFVKHPALVYQREMLLEKVYGQDKECLVFDRSIDAAIRRLRSKFKDVSPGYNPVKTVYGVGYKFNMD